MKYILTGTLDGVYVFGDGSLKELEDKTDMDKLYLLLLQTSSCNFISLIAFCGF